MYMNLQKMSYILTSSQRKALLPPHFTDNDWKVQRLNTLNPRPHFNGYKASSCLKTPDF